MRENLIHRNDVHFDRGVLAAGTGVPKTDQEALKQFLLRGWMTHDAMWFKSALEECGIDLTNRLNRRAIRSMSPIEVKRVQQALGLEEVRSFDQLKAFMTGAMSLLCGDFMSFRWEWRPPDALRVDVQQCFANEGIKRLGALDRYKCGIFDRIYGWLDVLGVKHQVSPTVEHCTKHRDGTCVRELRFSF